MTYVSIFDSDSLQITIQSYLYVRIIMPAAYQLSSRDIWSRSLRASSPARSAKSVPVEA